MEGKSKLFEEIFVQTSVNAGNVKNGLEIIINILAILKGIRIGAILPFNCTKNGVNKANCLKLRNILQSLPNIYTSYYFHNNFILCNAKYTNLIHDIQYIHSLSKNASFLRNLAPQTQDDLHIRTGKILGYFTPTSITDPDFQTKRIADVGITIDIIGPNSNYFETQFFPQTIVRKSTHTEEENEDFLSTIREQLIEMEHVLETFQLPKGFTILNARHYIHRRHFLTGTNER